MSMMPYQHIRVYGHDGRRIGDEYLSLDAAIDAHRRTVALGRAAISKVIERTPREDGPDKITVLANWVNRAKADA
ncbi:hypothetical protein [Chelativorans xinjiangense]|uniref:hypothetical protein n=1 Tax=Chelativorans xinjiangense TaxID=2681485 RepID=UPI00135C52D6|nr:hypothetical protein [Chelativorans xinjiangense]